MKVIEHIERAKNPLFSFEIVPPPRGRSIGEIINTIEILKPFNPAWIDVTSHSSQATYVEHADGSIEKVISKKRPGTIGICGVIQNRFDIDTVAHILCLGFSKEETEDALIELRFLGVENILALRGDNLNHNKAFAKNRKTNAFAKDLVKQIRDLSEGKFLSPLEGAAPLDFCVGVAGYPEKHFESPNFATDLDFLKEKVAAGADYIITQMFFENERFFSFKAECEKLNMKVPIIPGLKILRTSEHLKSIPKTFFVDLPEHLSKEILANPKHAEEIGYQHAVQQCLGLLEGGVKNLHFYVLNDAPILAKLLKKIGF